jgi:hypothetical protein
VRLYHIFREGNMSADVLAKLGARATSNLVILNNPPIELQLALLADAMGVSHSRA